MFSCKKDNNVTSNVDHYINLVKANKYISDFLPSLTYQAIPELLKYANDTNLITNYPVSPLSSYGHIPITVGELLLWTIEAIRIYDQQPSIKLGLHSLAPLIGATGSPTINNKQLIEVYNLYNSWWYSNVGKDFETTNKINPLNNTLYWWR